MDEGEEVDGATIEANCEASEVLQLVEAAFDAVAVLLGSRSALIAVRCFDAARLNVVACASR